MQDAVHNFSVLQDNDNPGSEPHHQGGREDVLGAGNELVRYAVGRKAGNDTAKDAHGQEQAGNFGHVPAPEGGPGDKGNDGDKQHPQNPRLSCRKGFRIEGAPLLRLPPGPFGIKDHKQAEQSGQEGPAEDAVAHA